MRKHLLFILRILTAFLIRIANLFRSAFEALKHDAFAYEFTVREQLSHIMLAVYSELKPQLHDTPVHQDINSVRVAKILSFIEQRYSKNLTLSDLADIVHISEREMLRKKKKKCRNKKHRNRKQRK